MKHNPVTDSSNVSHTRARRRHAVFAIALAGLLALALLLTLAGSPLAWPVWAGTFAGLGSMALFASRAVRRPASRFPLARRLLARAACALAVLLLMLSVGETPPTDAQVPLISIAVRVSGGSLVAGQNVTILVEIQNRLTLGTNIGGDINLDIFPQFFGGSASLIEFSQPFFGTCSSSGDNVNCTLDGIFAGDTIGIAVTYALDPDYVADGANQVGVQTHLFCEEEDDDDDKPTCTIPGDATFIDLQGTGSFGVTSSADLAITKLGDAVARAGENFEYTIVVENFGPSNARNVVVEDDVLSSETIDFISATGAPGGCLITGSGDERRLVCDLNTMTPGEREEINITVRSDETAIINNTALVSSHVTDGDPDSEILDPDPVSFNNRATAFTSVTDVADLEVTKTTAATSVPVSGTIQYTIIVTNTGPSEAENVVLVDFLPAGIRDNVQISAGQGECTPGTPPTAPAVCNLGTLASGQSVQVDVTFELLPTYPVEIVNTIQNEVQVLSDTFDPDNTNNRASTETPVLERTDLEITKIDLQDPVVAGQRMSYVITVINHGPADATNVTVVDTLPTPATGAFNFAGSMENCSAVGNIVTCNLGTIDNGRSKTFTINVDVDPNVPTGTYTNTATVSSDVTELSPDPHSNTATQTTTVETLADLRIFKLADPPSIVVAGELFTYTLVVDNLGPSDAANVVLTDTLDSQVTFISATPTQTSGPNPLVWNPLVNPLAAGDRVTVTVTVMANADISAPFNPLRNQVIVGSATDDPNPLNNETFSFVTPTSFSDLVVTKTAVGQVTGTDGTVSQQANRVTAGQLLTYTISITNNGPSDAQGVSVQDILPAGVTIVDKPDFCTTQMVCNLGDISFNVEAAPTEFTFTVEASEFLPDEFLLHNSGRVFSESFDPDNSNNVFNQTTEVNTIVDLGIRKVALQRNEFVDTQCDEEGGTSPCDVDDVFIAGLPLEYQLYIRNAGPSVADNVLVTDTLPISTTFLSAAVKNASGVCRYQPGSHQVHCNLSDVAPNPEPDQEVLISINVLPDPAAPDGAQLVNTAAVDSDTAEIDTTLLMNNTLGRSPDSVNQIGALLNIAINIIKNLQKKADLLIVKVDTGSPVVAGLTTRYTIVVANLGPSAAENVTVDDTLPPGFTYLDGVDDCTGTATGFSCNLGDLAPGQTSQFFVTVGIDPDVTPTDFTLVPEAPVYTDTVTVDSDTDDPDTGNNTDTHVTRVQDFADMRVRKLGRPDQVVVAGEIMTYTLSIENLGPSIARNVVVTDTLDPDLTFISSSIEGVNTPPNRNILDPTTGERQLGWDLGTIAVPNPFDPNDQQIPGRVEIDVVVRANRDINFPFDSIVNYVEVRSSAQDPNPINNITQRITRVTAESDMQISKSAVGQNVQNSATAPAPIVELADQVTAGTFITYTLNITNAGPSDAVNVSVQDFVPPGVEPRTATITRGDGFAGTCTLGGLLDGRVQCDIDTLGVYPVTTITSTATMTITGFVATSVPEGFFLNNNAVVSSEYHDPDNTNNRTQNQTLVNARADLVIAKADDPDPVIAGELLKYTITITNAGPSDALNVVVTDTLPVDTNGEPQVVFLNSTIGTCRADPINPEIVTCPLGRLLDEQTVSFDILVLVKPDVVQAGETFRTITNTVEVDIPQTAAGLPRDPVLSNNITTETTRVEAEADLIITKADAPDPVVAGQQVIYIISFSNQGPSTARNVVVTDTLPAGINFNRCEPIDPDDEVTCTAGLSPVQPGQVVTLTRLLVRGTVEMVDGDMAFTANLRGGNEVPPVITDGSGVADFILNEDETELDYRITVKDLQGSITAAHIHCAPSGANGPVGVTLNAVALEGTITAPDVGNTCGWSTLADVVTDIRSGNAYVNVHTTFAPAGEVRGQIRGSDLEPGEGYTFAIVADVDPGYVLDFKAVDALNPTPVVNPNNPAHNTAYIASETPEVNPNDNQDTALTTVVSSADLSIDKTDSAGTVPPLGGDPVTQGTVFTYTLTIKNSGPSDAASVQVIDQLPEGLILDPAVITPTIEITYPVESDPDEPIVLDTGLIIIELGRMNVDSQAIITIPVRVATITPSGVLTNTAFVTTIANDNKFTASLKGINEVPPVDTPASGVTVFTLNTDETELSYRISVEDLQGSITAAHIHCAAFGVNGPVGVTLDAVALEGTITAPDVGNTCGWTTLADVVADMRSGDAYVNVHTTFASAGEVRGQIQPFSSPTADTKAPSIDPNGPAPTPDPNLANNVDTETTTVVSPAIQIDKTISLDGTCPGTNNIAIGFLGQPVTYCYEITNTGDTYLDFVRVVDVVTTRSGPIPIFDETLRSVPEDQGGEPLLPVPPGASFMLSTTVSSDIFIDCNDRPDTARAFGVPVNSGRTILAAVFATLENGVVTDADDAQIETPCKGVDWRLQLPALETIECETWIQVQNVGNKFTKALLVLWGEPGACPPQSFGPMKVECTGLLREGSAWTFTNQVLPPGAKSGIIYSMNATDVVTDERGNERLFADLACGRLSPLIRQNYDEWLLFDRAYRERSTYFGPIGDFPGEQLVLDFGAHQGEPLAVTVNRTCPDPIDPNLQNSAAYVGISTDREGIRDPRAGGFAYYTPLVWADFFGMNSIINIQNSGEECTSVEMWFQRQGDCIRPVVWDILQLAPGESVAFDPNQVVGPQWQGSVWLSASQPLGIVVDTLGANHFGAYHGVPADVADGFQNGRDFTLGTQVNYAPLIYREQQGWETMIQVQNLSSTYNAKVKVYFLDNSGGVINTVVDWICPRGSQTYFLPVIAGLPGNWVGSARIESQDWFSPGDPAISAPRILSVVMLEKYTDPAKVARQEAVVYNALQEMGSFDWQVGPGFVDGFGGSDVLSIPLVAKGNRGVTSEIAIQNLNPNPGSTDFIIYLYDQNRLIDGFCQKLNAKQVEYIDINEWGVIPPGFLGSVVISATYTDQRGGAALGAVAVERVGGVLSGPDIPGDESKAFEAFPLFNRFTPEKGTPITCPGQP